MFKLSWNHQLEKDWFLLNVLLQVEFDQTELLGKEQQCSERVLPVLNVKYQPQGDVMVMLLIWIFQTVYRGYPCHSINNDRLGAHLVVRLDDFQFSSNRGH